MILFERFDAIVMKVTDGDTITVTAGVHMFHIRLAHIDAPEDGQPFCLESKRALSALIYGKTVEVKPIGTDRYSRLVAEVKIEMVGDVSEFMIRNGYARWYDRKKRNEYYGFLEEEARKSKVGMWALNYQETPWDFRKNKGGRIKNNR